MRKLLVGVVAASSIAIGSAAVVVANPLGIAGAQSPPSTAASTPPGTTPGTPGTPPTDPGSSTGKGGPRGRGFGGSNALSDTLKDLVAKGTITQAQADAIENGVKDRLKDGPDGRGPREFVGDFLQTAASTIGIDTKTLITELRDGKSIADVAKAHNVDPQKVIDAIVAQANTEIDKAVNDKKLSADQAAKIKSSLPDRISKLVNDTHAGRGGFGPGHHGPGGPGDNGPSTAPPTNGAPTTTPPSTDAPTTAPPATDAPTTAAPTTQPPTTDAPTTAATPPGTN
jgi:hypothetical protein